MNEWEKQTENEPARRGHTESYFSAVKRRLNLQALGAYIRDGSEKKVLHNESFAQREAEAYAKLEQFIAATCGEGAGDVIDQINAYAATVEEIYFNLGLKAGATLQSRLTGTFETDI